MGETIRTFSDGSSVEFGPGRFDGWCVYITDPSGRKAPPRDADYFRDLEILAGKYGAGRVYDDFVQVYRQTGKAVSDQVLDDISGIAAGYGGDSLAADRTFTVLYLAMIAEENRANTRLGRRIKRLGVHKLLKENRPLDEAVNFMRGMNSQEIDRLCRGRGF